MRIQPMKGMILKHLKLKQEQHVPNTTFTSEQSRNEDHQNKAGVREALTK